MKIHVKTAFDVATSITLVALAGVIAWPRLSTVRDAPAPDVMLRSRIVPFDDAVGRIKGAMTARVGMIVFSDFECPYCARFANEILPVLQRTYVDSSAMRLAFRHLPLANHKLAPNAAQLAECGAGVGRFWLVHDELFRGPRALTESTLIEAARVVGLKEKELQLCRVSAQTRIAADQKLATELGITSTPFIIIGAFEGGKVRVSRVILGARPLSDFAAAIDADVAATSGKS